MTEKRGTFSWDVKKIADALKIKEADVRLYFRDGRRVSFLLERRLAYEVIGGPIAPTEGADYDIKDSDGNKWEVRSITKDGVYFCPSYMVGSGRSFGEKGFLDKLKNIKGYVLCDVESFPDVPFWVIPVEQVIKWWNDKKLGNTTKISRDRALSLIHPSLR